MLLLDWKENTPFADVYIWRVEDLLTLCGKEPTCLTVPSFTEVAAQTNRILHHSEHRYHHP